jgi:hypothetical protein
MSKGADDEARKMICLSPKVVERISGLRLAGGIGRLLAEKAEALIARLKSGHSGITSGMADQRTPKGEKRIRKCVKYDLGWGHRIVTLLRGETLFVCCLGSHDECDRWLEKNSRVKTFEMPNGTVHRVSIQRPDVQVDGSEPSQGPIDDLEQRLMSLSDRQIRNIFCGLVEARQRIRSSDDRWRNGFPVTKAKS